MFIEPAIILGMGMAGGTMRITRTMMLEVLRQDYIRTAWAKGLRERVVVLRHTLKNALIPVITVIGSQLVIMIGGDVIVEQIFNLPGLGRLLMSAVSLRNYPVVSGVLFVFAIGMVVINLLVDLTYGYLDPRVAYR
jgi:peptide/nickel transport system permease protein